MRSPGSTARCWIGRSTSPSTGASVCPADGQCIAFHRVADYTPPTWPTQERPKQMHLDMLVDDLDAAEAAVINLGGTKHPDQPGTSYRVFLDPAGHPFCLCLE
ncbi:VOC family protein [Polymorphospora rubra]|uniref:VOC family protein n=1 Tax=Polymorphospora rubra TaxID=338584 RepID=UPI0033FE95D8